MRWQTDKKSTVVVFVGKLETLFRLIEAQPYLLKVWNMSGIFDSKVDKMVGSSPNHRFLLSYLRHLTVPENAHFTSQMASLKSIDTLTYIDSLRLQETKEQEVLKQ